MARESGYPDDLAVAIVVAGAASPDVDPKQAARSRATWLTREAYTAYLAYQALFDEEGGDPGTFADWAKELVE